MEDRERVFQQLKPVCVAVSRIALQYKSRQAGAKQVVEALGRLFDALRGLEVLDEKLADYVFFPLSYTFRDSSILPPRAVELSLGSLQVLIDKGWRQNISPDFFKQLLILLGYFAGRDQFDIAIKDVSDATYVAVFSCMIHLFEHASAALSSFSESDESESLPAIGLVVSVALGALTQSSSVDVQIQAVQAIRTLISLLPNQQMLRNFLPGIMSNLSKVLQPNTRSRKPHRVLAECLATMSQVLEKTLSNHLVRSSAHEDPGAQAPPAQVALKTDPGWLKASTAQIKRALANITSLRNHERPEVLEALFQLCVVVLSDCSEALYEAASLMLETLICICSRDAGSGQSLKLLQTVQGLVAARGSLYDILLAVAFDWISTLPRVLLSADDARHHQHVDQIATAYKLIASMSGTTLMLEAALTSSLQDATFAIMNLSPGSSIQVLRTDFMDVSVTLSTKSSTQDSFQFNALPIAGIKQSSTLQEINRLVSRLGYALPRTMLMRHLTNMLPNATGNSHLAALWFSSRLFHDLASETTDVEWFVEDVFEMNATMIAFMEATYSHSIDMLSATAMEDGNDWRLQALALEIVAMQSIHDGLNYRSELVDAVYPILERIGSSNTLLRDHAMTCLNITARACKYQCASDLIIQNADYLVNSVALKLNTFEFSPQAPQVIGIMVRLCGPKLIPYLDDLVDSIFSTLASFHGYPRLAASLFSALKIIVEVSSSGSLSAIEEKAVGLRRKASDPTNISDVADTLTHRKARNKRIEDLPENEPSPKKKPASNAQRTSTENTPEDPDEESPGKNSTAVSSNPVMPTKAYITTQSIVHLTQHYLTHSSPTLRRHLLYLTSIGCLALSVNEDKYLPIINDIWPVVVKRLYDTEPFVCIAATEALCKIFLTAGDFISSRVTSEWGDICKLYRRIYVKVMAENTGKGGRGNYTSVRQIWEALIGMLVDLARYVRLDPDTEDDLMEMLGPLIETKVDVRNALNALNPDAVWLHLEMHRQQPGRQATPPASTIAASLLKT